MNTSAKINLETNILLIEDDKVLSKEISAFLQNENLNCTACFNMDDFQKYFESKKFDCILLDINLDKINGLDLIKIIRSKDSDSSILMITAYSDISDKKEAFHLGADDYLVKPFHLDELLLRINALIKRNKKNNICEEYQIDDLYINISDKLVRRGGKEIILTPKEFELLLFLVKAEGKTVSKQLIAEKVWNENIDTNFNTIEVFINFLRKKIDKDQKIKLIHTRSGYGYYIKPEI